MGIYASGRVCSIILPDFFQFQAASDVLARQNQEIFREFGLFSNYIKINQIIFGYFKIFCLIL